jgi:hypothetical protein
VPRGTVQTNLGAFGRPFVDSPGAFHLAAPAGALVNSHRGPCARAWIPPDWCWKALVTIPPRLSPPRSFLITAPARQLTPAEHSA